MRIGAHSEAMAPRFPMTMTIRCYDCGKVYDGVITSVELHEFPCPACGKIEAIHLRSLMEKAAASQKLRVKPRWSR